jgi:uncharacterized protein (UPF0147 family)
MTALTDEIVKLVTILQSPSIPEERKLVAEKRLRNIRFQVTAEKYGVPADRVEDVMQLESIIDDPLTPENYREVAKKSLYKIVHESSAVKSMRKSLIKEMKAGNSENVRDITEFVSKHSKYQ